MQFIKYCNKSTVFVLAFKDVKANFEKRNKANQDARVGYRLDLKL